VRRACQERVSNDPESEKFMNERIKPRAVIQKIVERLVAEYPPQKIILFGSYAYGQPDPDSDIDLLIIKATGEGFLERLHTVRRVTGGTHPSVPFDPIVGTHPSVPFDPIVLTPTEMADRLEAGDQFLREILDRGEVLYAA